MASGFYFQHLLYYGWLKKSNEFTFFQCIPLLPQIEQLLQIRDLLGHGSSWQRQ